MGLDTSHDAWHGAYSAFMRWREKIAAVAGLPPLCLMEGFFERGDYRDPIAPCAKQWENLAAAVYESLPIRWSSLRPSPLHELLHHSDCEGKISAKRCGKIADALESLLPELEKQSDGGGHIGNYADKTRQFIKGCRAAFDANEPLDFH